MPFEHFLPCIIFYSLLSFYVCRTLPLGCSWWTAVRHHAASLLVRLPLTQQGSLQGHALVTPLFIVLLLSHTSLWLKRNGCRAPPYSSRVKRVCYPYPQQSHECRSCWDQEAIGLALERLCSVAPHLVGVTDVAQCLTQKTQKHGVLESGLWSWVLLQDAWQSSLITMLKCLSWLELQQPQQSFSNWYKLQVWLEGPGCSQWFNATIQGK